LQLGETEDSPEVGFPSIAPAWRVVDEYGVSQDLRTLGVLWYASNIRPNFPDADFGGSKGLHFYE